MNCCVCNNKLAFWELLFQAKGAEGTVCSCCKKKFPSVLQMSYYNGITIAAINNYVQRNKKEFFCTTQYGKLLLDDAHGLIAYSETGKKADVKNNVFRIEDVKAIDLTLSEPKITKYYVYSDILFYLQLEKFNAGFSRTIKHNERSRFKRIDAERISFDPPNGYIFTRAIISQMLSNSLSNLRHILNEIKEERQNIEQEMQKSAKVDIVKAEAILMLDNNYTADDVKKHFRYLTKNLHPDVNDSYGDEYMQKINWAYDILSKKVIK